MQIPVINGIYADEVADWRSSYPRNLIAVPKPQGISSGYLRPAEGIVTFGAGGPGVDRGGINWAGTHYRVMGNKLVRVDADGSIVQLGNIAGTGQATLDYGFDRLAIWSGGFLYYWDGSALTRVTDTDLGTVIDGMWIAGYYLSTDGTSLIVTELNNPNAVNPLKYGSSEADPDPIISVLKLRNEAYALNRHSIEVFDNVGGDNFPFQRIEGAQVPRGCVGTHACEVFQDAIAFVGNGRNEATAVWLASSGQVAKLSTREIDQQLQRYTEQQLAGIVMETMVDKGHQQLRIHLPDQCLMYDGAASQIVGEPVWHVLTSSVVGLGTYRARNLVRVDDSWIAGDPTTALIGKLSSTTAAHHGSKTGWDFSTVALYNAGAAGVVHELELVCLPGRVDFGVDPTVWVSYSDDGETWSQERPIKAGKQGERLKRLAWRRLGRFQTWRVFKFRGTSDARLSIARLEAQIESLSTAIG
jgi:hypothetical protein